MIAKFCPSPPRDPLILHTVGLVSASPIYVRTLTLFFLFLFFHQAHANVACSTSNDGTYFIKADGSRIHLLFGQHQTPGESGLGHVQTQLREASLASSNSDSRIQSYVSNLLASRSSARASIERQSDRIEALVRTGEIEWIANESLPANFNPALQNSWFEGAREVMTSLRQHGVPESQVQDLLAYSWGPYMDEMINEVPWANNLRSVAVDTDPGKDEFISIMNEINQMNSQNGFHSDNPLLNPNGLTQFNADNPRTPFEWILWATNRFEYQGGSFTLAEVSQFPNHFPEELRSTMERWIGLQYRLGQINVQRDRTTARNLLMVPGNGALVMGNAHSEGVLSYLRIICQQQLESYELTSENQHSVQ